MFFFEPLYMIMVAFPVMIIMGVAQWRVRSAYQRGLQVPAELSGAGAARYLLDHAGCEDVGIEETHGHLSDHYDPRHRVLRLSADVYHGRSATSVGIAAHEAGHALQHAQNYGPLVVRNAAVPAAQFGPMASMILLILGAILSFGGGSPIGGMMILLGLIAFGAVVFFQLVNLPVEFDASNRAKRLLTEHQIVDAQGSAAVSQVLNAAAWTYIAATLQAVLTLLYYIIRYGHLISGGRNDD